MLFSAVNEKNEPLWRLVIEGLKTQTRRPIREGDYMPVMSKVLHAQVVSATGHIRYEVGRTYAVQPGRGQPTIAVARMRTPEGIQYRYPQMIEADNSLLLWDCSRLARIKLLEIRREDVRNITPEDALAEGFSNPLNFLAVWRNLYDPKAGMLDLDNRPAELYQAWALRFEMDFAVQLG